MMVTGEYAVVWICTDCLVMLANGERAERDPCGECGQSDGWLCDVGRGEPLSRVADGELWTLGLVDDEHECGVPYDAEPARECGCEGREFSRSWCDGCGTSLAGARYAATAWSVEA